MLHQMMEDYEADPVYVLDMYRHGKVSWGLDFAIRAGIGPLLLVFSDIVEGMKKVIRRKAEEERKRQIGIGGFV